MYETAAAKSCPRQIGQRAPGLALFAAAAVAALASAAANAKGANAANKGVAPGIGPHPLMGYLTEPASAFVPGAYYFQKASFYLKNHRIAAAIDMLRLASASGHKLAQYDLGVIYFNGVDGTPVDRSRGVAWFGIAAQNHTEQADLALLQGWKLLSAQERKTANAITADLLPDYADAITARRAKNEFVADRNKVTGSRLGHPGHLAVTVVGSGDGVDSEGVVFIADQHKRLEQMLEGAAGSVEVGALQEAGKAAPAPTSKDE